jgi:hypothetical protein
MKRAGKVFLSLCFDSFNMIWFSVRIIFEWEKNSFSSFRSFKCCWALAARTASSVISIFSLQFHILYCQHKKQCKTNAPINITILSVWSMNCVIRGTQSQLMALNCTVFEYRSHRLPNVTKVETPEVTLMCMLQCSTLTLLLQNCNIQRCSSRYIM